MPGRCLGLSPGACYPGAACLPLSEPLLWGDPPRGRGIACRSTLPFGPGAICLGLENKASDLQWIETGEGGRKREGERRKEKEREHTPCGGLSWKSRVEDAWISEGSRGFSSPPPSSSPALPSGGRMHCDLREVTNGENMCAWSRGLWRTRCLHHLCPLINPQGMFSCCSRLLGEKTGSGRAGHVCRSSSPWGLVVAALFYEVHVGLCVCLNTFLSTS